MPSHAAFARAQLASACVRLYSLYWYKSTCLGARPHTGHQPVEAVGPNRDPPTDRRRDVAWHKFASVFGLCTSSKASKVSTGTVHVDLTHAVYWQRERISDRLKHALVERHGNNDARRSHLCILYLVSHYTDRRLCIEDIGASASYADVC